MTATDANQTLLVRLKQYQNILSEIQSRDGELNEELVKELIEKQTNIAVKVDAIAYVLDELAMSSKNLREQAKALEYVAEMRDRASEWLKNYVKYGIESTGENLQGITYEFKLRSNPPSVVIENEGVIPDEYKIVKTTVSIDKVAVKKAIQEFKSVPGASLKETKTVVKKVKS
jgi:hypothetical protein